VVLNFIEFLNYTLNINVKGMGIPKDSFGSMMITNIGSLGFDNAFVPLAPYTRCPLIFALGKIHWAPYCTDEGEIKARKEVSMCVTFDHRVIDGARGAMVANLVHEYFNHPEKLEGE
jgi:pyruvate dehydrogenase E2 component (dihydrolipoamide acetyltransferase)